MTSFFFLEIYFYFWLHWVFVAVWAFSSCGTQTSHCGGSSLQRQSQSLGSLGFVALGQVESSQTRDQFCVPGIGRQILNHWPIREVHISS